MKLNALIFRLLLCAIIIQPTQGAPISITQFGSQAFNPVDIPNDIIETSWIASTTQTGIDLTLTDVTVSSNNPAIYSPLTTQVVYIGSAPMLSLQGTFSGSVPSVDSFFIELYDAAGDSVIAQYRWSDFQGGNTISADLVAGDQLYGAFNGTISAWGFGFPGYDTDAITFTFSGLAAVPEPDSFALCVAAILCLFLLRMINRDKSQARRICLSAIID